MCEGLMRVWRIFATGFCFMVFALGSLLLGLVLFPMLRMLVRNSLTRSRVARLVIQGLFKCFVGLMRGLGVMTYQVKGRNRLRRRGQLIVANHPSLIDVVILMSMVGNANCVVKASLARNPFTWGPVTAADFIFNDSGVGLMQDCIDSLNSGSNLIIFPEGTRTPNVGPRHLQRGAANVAVRSGRDITPVRIIVSPAVLGKDQRWYHMPQSRPHFLLEFEPDIAVANFIQDTGNEALATRRLNEHLTQHFSMETRRAAA
ncbi:1-acyl-sn-glycerol-3-phosphate acyltransferase [Rhodoferax sp.]|uniref:lysophospholipid acyltransferase family protein n=1 Tax=Rhodoferax sp. TaxID=50421 RepID=UPI0019F8E21C|nr:lysophospholipid acyltransferase family protein [Rhodoferax sp.]MBE0474784.1 1-acyl-sn-glycerol-3-phosphate acyltransferase [Rhodoferax sp.]